MVNAQTGELSYDNYKGSWGNEQELHKLIQEYSVLLVEAQLEEFRLQGWTIERQRQPNGDIQIVAAQ